MIKKTIIFAFIIAVAMAQRDIQSKNVGNKVDDLLKKLREKVDAGMAKCQAELDAAKAKINEIADQVQASAKSAMQSSVDAVKTEIDKLKEKARNAGVNIDECLNGNEAAILALPDKYSGNMVHCVSDRITEGIGYAQDALNQVQKIVDDVENIKKEIKDCGHGWKSAKCLAKLAIKIEEDITTLPAKIEVDIAATVALITQLKEKIEKCASDKTDDCESEAETILATIATCVAGKIV